MVPFLLSNKHECNSASAYSLLSRIHGVESSSVVNCKRKHVLSSLLYNSQSQLICPHEIEISLMDCMTSRI